MTASESMLSFLLCRARDLVISGAYMQALVVKQSVNGFAACLVSDVADIAYIPGLAYVDQTDLDPNYTDSGNLSDMHPVQIA
ncbi:hypothetical protein PoMZ_06112 [Pyricularia oryzae]|uniref:Uncharacterized protein n=1 Tax=Pyricularia oryzae TaxID=318829 RepID=A0A4P7NPV9_PYROR|nr:hypothetical protein PoMZ_06112 [Pyricularia oryzae]